METLFIPVKLRISLDKSEISKISKTIPKKIVIVYSIQYLNLAKEIKEMLKKERNIIDFVQVLGCTKPKFPKSTQAILLLSDGKFHAIALAHETGLPVYIYNSRLEQISKDEISSFEKKKKASYVKFLNARTIGILVSTKPGQQRLKQALELRKKSDKISYIFISNNINSSEFENFPEINSWVNTACPRLDMNDLPIINIDNLKLLQC